MGRRMRAKGEGKSEGELHNTEKKQKQVVLHYSICNEFLDMNDKVHRGFFHKKVLCEGKIREKEVSCIVLESSDSISALHQRDMTCFLGKGTLELYCVDEEFVVLEDIKYTISGWYSSLFKEIKENDWNKCIDMHLKKFLKGFIKSLIKLYPNHCHGNLKNGLAVMENGEGRIYNMKYPGNKDYPKDLEQLASIMDFILSRSCPSSLGFIDEFTLHVSKERLSDHYRSRCSEEFADFMVHMRLIIQKKMEFFAPLYPVFLWSSEERYRFMEDIHDLFWIEKWSHLARYFNVFFDGEWEWWNNIPPAGGFKETYYYGVDVDGGKASYLKHPVESIRFWMNCRNHYNDSYLRPEDSLSAREIELKLEETFGICGTVFRAMCSFVINEKNSKPRFSTTYPWSVLAKIDDNYREVLQMLIGTWSLNILSRHLLDG